MMSGSPLSKVSFRACGRSWTLKLGQRQRFRIEQEFGIGFGGAFLKTFPGVTEAAVESDDIESVTAAMVLEDVMLGSIVMFFACCILEQPDDDMVDLIVEDLGYQAVINLIGDAMRASSSPNVESKDVAEPASGE